jgi:sugar transferase (PEP-CTERM system associated)
VVGGLKLRFWNEPLEFELRATLPDLGAQILVIMAVFQICFYYNDLYDLHLIRSRTEFAVRLGQSLGAACLLLGLCYYLVPALLIGRGAFFIGVALTVSLIAAGRLTLDSIWHAAAPAQNVLIVGAGDLAVTVARELRRRDDLNLCLVGFVGDEGAAPALPGDLPLVPRSALETVAREQNISRIIVALEERRGKFPVEELARLRLQGVRIEEAHTAVAALTGRVWLRFLRPSWFVFSDGFQRSRIALALKRTLDVVLSVAGLIVLAPVMAIVAVAVGLSSAGPVLYCQVRVGLRGRCFELLKFRSMRADAESSHTAQWARQDDPRVTGVGRFLRRYRLDELPQFWNVLRGEMSFVGPRPERPEFVQMLRERIPYYDERHSVRPGITGWAQVQYRYGANFEDACRKLEYDLFYLQNLSVIFDCAIVLKTLRIVLLGWGAR